MAFSLWTYALRNVTRRPLRSGALSLGMAALAGTLLVLGAMHISVSRSVERGGARLGADAVVAASGWTAPPGGLLLSGGPPTSYLDPGTVERIRKFPSVKDSTGQLYIVSARLACCSMANTVLIGFDPVTDFTVTPWLRGELMRKIADDEVVAGPDILAEPGGRIRFFNKVFTIVAKLERTGMDQMDRAVFIPMKGARQMIAGAEEVKFEIDEGQLSAVLVRFREGMVHEAEAIRMEFDIPGVTVHLASDAMRSARLELASPLRAMAGMAALWWFVSIALAATLQGVTLEARAAETGLLRALGATGGRVFLALSYEAVFISLAGALAGVLGGFVYLLGMPSLSGGAGRLEVMTLGALALGAVVVCVVSALGSIAVPARRAARMKPGSPVLR